MKTSFYILSKELNRMNEDNNGNQNVSIIPKSIDKAIENVIDPTTKSAGNLLNDIFMSILGGPQKVLRSRAIKTETQIAIMEGKKELDIEFELEEYRKTLLEKQSAIPDESKLLPSLSTLQALENSKYSFDISELREMFANLVAKSMDDRYEEKVNPAFSEILKQMSLADTELTNYLSHYFDESFPIGELQLKSTDGSREYRVYQKNVFLTETIDSVSLDTINKRSIAISSLERLGIIDVSYSRRMNDDERYNYLNQYLEYVRKTTPVVENKRLELAKGLMEITPFGFDFLNMCCR